MTHHKQMTCVPPVVPRLEKHSAVGRIERIYPFIVFGLSLTLTIVFWNLYDASLKAKAHQVYVNKTNEIVSRVIRRMNDNEQILRGAVGLINASKDVSRDEWRRYVETLKLDENYHGIQGVGFSKWVKPAEKEEHIRKIRSQGFPNYTILPKGERLSYTSIIYLEPFDWRNQRAFGYDMFSEPVRQSAMVKARDSGRTSIAARVTLVQETKKDEQHGMLMYVPVYRSGSQTDTVEMRQQAILGFSYSPIRIRDFMYGLFGKMPTDIAFELYASESEQPEALLFSSIAEEKTIQHQGFTPLLTSRERFDAYGMKWLISFKALPPFSAEMNRNASYAVLTSGVFISLLFTLIAFMLYSANVKTLRYAEEIAESEDRFKSLSEASTGGIIVHDNGLILDCNKGLTDITGFAHEELIGMNGLDLIAPESLDTVLANIRSGYDQSYEVTGLRKDGSHYHLAIRGKNVHYKGRDVRVIEFRDITEIKLLENEKRAIERQFQQAQKMESLGVLAGGIAHDFNNILTSIIGNIDLALMRLSPESPVYENLQRIEKSAVRAADLARQMLAYSGKGQFYIESIDLNLLLKEMGQMLDVSISKKAELRYNLTSPLPTINADVSQIRQIIMNLVINAAEAIGDENGVITITSGCMACKESYLQEFWHMDPVPAGLYVFLEIADTGCGMSKDSLEKIFDPFFSTKFTGRGLGMSAVLGIVRGHKGAIKIDSEPGKGSSFKILLPAGEQPSEMFSGKESDDSWRGNGLALLVDDEEVVRTIGSEMLRELGFEVMTANDGREAVEIFKTRTDISFVILDLTMPHMDGEQCFRELRQINPDIKVIMSSGYNEQKVSQKFVGKGMAGFIQKPYKLSILREAIQKI